MRMEEETLRIVIGVLAALMVASRVYGVLNPKGMKNLAGKFTGLGPGLIRVLYLVIGLLGAWIIYSTLVIIFEMVPVFLVISLLFGILLLLAGIFVIHPEWFPQVVKGLVADRNELFVRFVCFLGVLGGGFVLLTVFGLL